MSEPERKKATYEDLYTIPENMTGEIIDGRLLVAPRPSRQHNLAAGLSPFEILGSYPSLSREAIQAAIA